MQKSGGSNPSNLKNDSGNESPPANAEYENAEHAKAEYENADYSNPEYANADYSNAEYVNDANTSVEVDSAKNGVDDEKLRKRDQKSATELKSLDTKSHENNVKSDEEKSPPVSARELFRFADEWDVLCMIAGSICAAAHGSSVPLFIVVFGNIIDGFVDAAKCGTSGGNSSFSSTEAPIILTTTISYTECPDIEEKMRTYALYFVYIGLGVIVFAYGQVAFWVLAAERQAHRIRLAFFRAALRQNVGWFDLHPSGEISTRLSEDVEKIQKGIGDKLGQFIQMFCMGFISVIVAFVKGWKLSLVILSLSPFLMLGAFIQSKVNRT